MKNILYFGDFDCTTGFGNVSKELVEEFSKKHFVTVFATNNYKKEPYNYSETVYVIPALNTRDDNDKDLYARKSFLKLLYNGNYDLVFCLNDLEVINELDEHLRTVKNARKKANKKSFKSIFYFPIDSPVRKKDLKVLSFFDEAVTYTEYAKQEVKRLLGFSPSYKKLKVIPHGVSLAYKKLDDKKRNKNFTFGCVNRNSVRKDFGTLLVAFSELKKDKDFKDCVLKLHCNPQDPFGLNLYRLCQRLELEIDKDVYFPDDFNENKGVSEKELNEFYNSIDCFVTTTTAVGWGLTVHEAMACETLVLCPMHTSLKEITDGGKCVVPVYHVSEKVYKDDFEKIRYVSNTFQVTEAMKYAVEIDPSVRAKKILDAKSIASKYNWKKTAEMFNRLIQKQIG